MFTKIGNGWELMKSSVQVLRLDASLLLFPFLSAIACLFVVGSFALPLFFTGALTIENVQPQQFTHNPLAYVVLFAFYFCNYFVIIFFNSALKGEILDSETWEAESGQTINCACRSSIKSARSSSQNGLVFGLSFR